MNRIILPMMGFETYVLMNSPLGNPLNRMEESIMKLQKKFWIWMLIYTIISWCFAFYITWITHT
ncbi:MAG: hypothetical protein IJF83_06590 [Methanobrevibacter sp.]|nr:hypothetical protein [Methanobrevibacter sp.]